MDEESKNWYRFSKLIIDVGPDILRKYVVESAQTHFLIVLEREWHKAVEKIQDVNFVSVEWVNIFQKVNSLDTALQTTLKPLVTPWNSSETGKMTLVQQSTRLQEWKREIETCVVASLPNAMDKLLSWLKQIQDKIDNLNAISQIIKSCTTGLFELCQQSRQKLIIIIKEHYDDFLSICSNKVSNWKHMTKDKVTEEINSLENVRKEKQESWNRESEKYFTSLQASMKNMLTSWKQKCRNIDLLITEVEAFERKVNAPDMKMLIAQCERWHATLKNLFKKWLETIDNVPDRRLLPVDSFVKELGNFHSIGLLQAKDIFVSGCSKIKSKIPKEQYSKLCPSSGLPELKMCDTTLLFVVLKSFLVCPPIEGWNEDPPHHDQSVGADILRLKSFRNDIVGHIEKTRIDRWTFDALWMSVTEVLCRLASHLGRQYEREIRTEVDRIKKYSIDSNREREFQRILQWCRNDILTEFKGIAKLNQCLNTLESIERVQRERAPSPVTDRRFEGGRGLFGVMGDGLDAVFGYR